MATIIPSHQYSQDSFLSWATRVSRTQISTVNGFSFSKVDKSSDNFTLDGVLRTVQGLGLARCPYEDITHISDIGEGGTFSVAKCRYQGNVVAVKFIKLGDNADGGRFESLSKRLRSVLQEVCIMHHEPLAKHPTILNLLGYGWQLSGGAPLPYVIVEHGEPGSLRSWLRSKPRKGLTWLRSKLTLAGDVAAGLMALHQCGIIHGDLKLDNVIVLDGYLERAAGVIAKIADFGHSILSSSDGKKDVKYYGTSLYNAPEVFMQDTVPIELAQMHKCDIWSFGLLVWEMLADGEWYFKYSWRHDPAFARTSNTMSNKADGLTTRSSDIAGSSETWVFVEHEDSHVFGTFDVCHLRALAKEFVKTSCGTDAQFEKSFLRPFFEKTLHVDPQNRPSDLNKLPIMRHWNQSGTERLRSKLAMQLKSSELSFDMFRLESAPELSWPDQIGMLEDIERIASWQEGGVRASVAAYQTGLCYILGFGSATDFSQGKFYLRKAAGIFHPLALLFNDRIFPALGDPVGSKVSSYAKLLSHFFRGNSKSLPRGIEEVKLIRQEESAMTDEIAYAQPLSTSSFLATLPATLRDHVKPEDLSLCLSINGAQIVLTILEAAILSGDAGLVARLASRLPPSAFQVLGITGELPLTQACKSGNVDMVSVLLKSGADPSIQSADGCTLLHWLFCIEDDLAMIERDLSRWSEQLSTIINLACSEVFTIHQQWPLRLHGTPLAIATMTCSQAVVELLLKLGADPMVRAFSSNTELFDDWSALHLAIKYHLAPICRIMIEQCGSKLENQSASGRFSTTFASALAFSSVVERYCIHGQNYTVALNETILRLPRSCFYTMSTDGRTPLMQAIDFDDIAVLESLLEFHPQLAVTRLLDSDDERQYTYPFLFACQLAARKDHPNPLRIPQMIASYDAYAFRRVDSHMRTCLHMAATGSSEILLKWLLHKGVSAYTLDDEGRSALFAVDRVPIFSTLLDNANHLNLQDQNQVSLAHYAVLDGRLEILKELVRLQAQLNSVCPKIGTPLHCAIANGSKLYVSVLLEAGVASDLPNLDGVTPMMLAIEMAASEMILELMAHGVRMNASCILNNSALDFLLRSQNVALWKTLSNEFRNRMDEHEKASVLHYLAWNRSFASSAFLQKLGMECHADPLESWKILASALSNGSTGDEHSLPFAVISGQTPIHTAVRFGNIDALKIFRIFSYPFFGPGLMDDDGRSPLHLAWKSPNSAEYPSTSSNLCATLLGNGTLFTSATVPAMLQPPLESYSFIWLNSTWEQARSRRDFGTLTAMIMLYKLDLTLSPKGGMLRLPQATGIRDLLSEAIRQNEVGFLITCLATPQVQYADMPAFQWLTPVGMMKLYYYADRYDMHMLYWRFNAKEELQARPVDKKTDYLNIGGEVRNFCYEWYMLELGDHYVGYRNDDHFDEPRKKLDEYEKTGKLSWFVRDEYMATITTSDERLKSLSLRFL